MILSFLFIPFSFSLLLQLYEKNKQKLMLGGIGKEEFSRNSSVRFNVCLFICFDGWCQVILQVLNAEERIEASKDRHNKLKASVHFHCVFRIVCLIVFV